MSGMLYKSSEASEEQNDFVFLITLNEVKLVWNNMKVSKRQIFLFNVTFGWPVYTHHKSSCYWLEVMLFVSLLLKFY